MKIKTQAKPILLCGAVALLVASGCASSTSGIVAGGRIDDPEYHVVSNNRTVNSQIEILSFNYDKVGKIPRAYATIRSNRKRSLTMKYRFNWYDERGIEIDPGSQPYRNIIIEGKDGVSISSVAPNPTAKEAKLDIKKVKLFRAEELIH